MKLSSKPDSYPILRLRSRSIGACIVNAIKAMRLWQWAKNILMFVPLFLAHQFDDVGKVLAGVIGFVIFGLCASATYIWNDLHDLAHDRKHPTKKNRPIASGALPPRSAALLSVGLLCVGFAGAYLLSNPIFLILVFGYVVISTLYSLFLKRLLIIDVLTLSGLYTYRLFLGASLTGIGLSPWILAFSLFFFLSLAFVKRYAELLAMQPSGASKLAGRSYAPIDAGLVVAFGTGAGLTAVLVFALYISSPTVKSMYTSPEVLWLVCPVLIYWIARIWFLAGRGKLQSDPVVFALTDIRSVIIGTICVALVVLGALWESNGLLERFIHFSV